MSDTLLFQHGLFEGVGVNELGVYQDGLVVSSRTNTDFLDRFLADLVSWAESDLGIVELDIPPKERHYETSVVVALNIKEEVAFPWAPALNNALKQSQVAYGLRPFEFSFSGFQFANDPLTYGGRKPIPFTLARRVNVPFEANIYFASGPLRTDDLLSVLRDLEISLS